MNADFMEALAQLEREKGIKVEVLVEAIEAALISAYRRNFSSAQNVRVQIARDTGEMHVFAQKTVVLDALDQRLEISLEAAMQLNPNYREGDIVELEVTPKDFGRIAAQTAKQVVLQRIREAERGVIYEAFSDLEQDIISGVVSRQDARFYYVDLERTEGMLPHSEAIPGERLRTGDRIKAFIARVEKTTKGPQIMLSRTHSGLVRRLLELEVPEIYDGVIEVRAVAREPGSRSKVAVFSRNMDVDAIGACVGQKGMRIQAIVTELRGEKIDIVEWSNDPALFVANSLAPAKVVDVEVREHEKTARVTVPDHQLSLAIGREGQNARLAAKLTGWKIDIKSESQLGRTGALFAELAGDLTLEE
ncbi:MAG: transcription termination factor NusA [Firmicutes bacterium]|nr:transcription termination factor NusA [Bacillota bacterium]